MLTVADHHIFYGIDEELKSISGEFVYTSHCAVPPETKLYKSDLCNSVGSQFTSSCKSQFLTSLAESVPVEFHSMSMADILTTISCQDSSWSVKRLAQHLLDLALEKPLSALVIRSPLMVKGGSPFLQQWPRDGHLTLHLCAMSWPPPVFYWTYRDLEHVHEVEAEANDEDLPPSDWELLESDTCRVSYSSQLKGYVSTIRIGDHEGHPNDVGRLYKCQASLEAPSGWKTLTLTRYFFLRNETDYGLSTGLPTTKLIRKVCLYLGTSEDLKNPLPGARQDATRLADLLRMRGFEVISFLNLTRCEVLQCLHRVVTSVMTSEPTLLWIYFSGHGVFCDQTPCFVTTDLASSCAVHPSTISAHGTQCPVGSFPGEVTFDQRLVSMREVHTILSRCDGSLVYMLFLDFCLNSEPQTCHLAIRSTSHKVTSAPKCSITIMATHPFSSTVELDDYNKPRVCGEIFTQSVLSSRLSELITKCPECTTVGLLVELLSRRAQCVVLGSLPKVSPSMQRLLSIELFRGRERLSSDLFSELSQFQVPNLLRLDSETDLSLNNAFPSNYLENIGGQNFHSFYLKERLYLKREEVKRAFSKATITFETHRCFDSTWCRGFRVSDLQRLSSSVDGQSCPSYFFIYCRQRNSYKVHVAPCEILQTFFTPDTTLLM